MVSLITYPEDEEIEYPEEKLHEIIHEMVTAKGDNKLEKMEDSIYEGSHAVDFKITNPKFDVKGKAFIMDKTVYVLTYVAPKQDFSMDDYVRFVNSFELLPLGRKSCWNGKCTKEVIREKK